MTPPAPRLALPPDGIACAAVCAVLFVGAFVALAVYHLATWSEPPACAAIAAVVWLGLVGVCLLGAMQSVGLRGVPAACLGPFSARHFADARTENGRTVIGFGFELFGRRLYHLRVTPEQLASVDMSSGQATAIAGRDMADWSVALWYRDSPASARDPEVYLIGPARAKETTAELLAVVVAFLRTAGVELEPSAREGEFTRREP